MSPDQYTSARARRARVVVFEALYERDVAAHDARQALARRLETADADVDTQYADRLLTLVEQHLPAIDATLADAASAFPVEQMAKVDKAILRLAIAELLFDNGVPEKALTSEAVRLAERYGGDSAPRFVHGVLNAIASLTKRQ